MTEVAFYQLRTMPLERALPKLLEKVLGSGHRAVVLGASEERIEALNAALWSGDPNAFMPHGSARDGRPERQPIYLTAAEENPNGADILVVVDGGEPAMMTAFQRCLDIFDGTDTETLKAARQRWAARKDQGVAVSYFEQSADGRWERRA